MSSAQTIRKTRIEEKWMAAPSPTIAIPEWVKTLIIIVVAAVIGAVIGILIRKLVLRR